MICENACVCIRRCDLWKRRVVNKHHQQSCCGQKRVCTYVVVSSKTDLRIHKAKVWGGVGWVVLITYRSAARQNWGYIRPKGGVGWGGADLAQTCELEGLTSWLQAFSTNWLQAFSTTWTQVLSQDMQQVSSASHTQRVHRQYVEMRHTFPTCSII